MPLRSTLTRLLLIGRLKHGLSLTPVLFLSWTNDILTNFVPFVVIIDPLSYGPLIRRPEHLPYSFHWTEESSGLLIGPLSY